MSLITCVVNDIYISDTFIYRKPNNLMKGVIILFGKKRGRVFEKWSYNAQSSILVTPAITKYKEIVIATMDGRILKLDSNGRVIWEYQASKKIDKVEAMFLEKQELNAIYSSPSLYDINGDGEMEILVGSDVGLVFVLDMHGNPVWSFSVRGPVRGKVVFCKSHVYFGCADGYLYCLDYRGVLVWRYNTKSRIESNPFCHDERIYFGANNGIMYCLDFDGKLVWTFKTEGSIIAEPVVAELYHKVEYLIFGSTDNRVYCLDLDGKLNWRFETEGRILSKVAVADIDRNGEPEIVFGSCDNSVYAVNNTGHLLWSFETDFWVVATPIITDIDDDGRLEIVVSSYDNTVYILDAEGSFALDYMPGISGIVIQSGHYTNVLTSDPGELVGKKVWEYKAEGLITGSALLESNQVIISTKKGLLDDIAYAR